MLKLALLYYFVFKKMDDPTYNPAQDVEAELLTDLKGNDNDEWAALRKHNRLRWLTRGFSQYATNLETLRTCLRDFVKSASSEFDSYPSQLYLSVSADILDTDDDRMRIEKKFFRIDALQEKGMGVLKYITIEDASAAGNSLCSVPVSMTFEPMHYYNSSQEAEEQFSMKYNISSFVFLGESNRVQVVPLGTFSANEDSDTLYRTPIVLQDQAKKCYERGYKHILYVAQAPYSSSLHMTSAETAEEQFFMSGSILQSLKGGQSDLHIYPVYCDKFYVVKISGKVVESLYVDDTGELRSLHNDPNRSSVVFFNLLNGIIIGKEQMQRLYNGVVSYATLINVYDDPIYDQDIRNDLLDNPKPGSLKKDKNSTGCT